MTEQRETQWITMGPTGDHDEDGGAEWIAEYHSTPWAVERRQPGSRRTSISRTTRERIRARDRGRCRYCARQTPDGVIDHVVAFVWQGADDESNFVLACRSCNSAKSDDCWDPLPVNVMTKTMEMLSFAIAAALEKGAPATKALEFGMNVIARECPRDEMWECVVAVAAMAQTSHPFWAPFAMLFNEAQAGKKPGAGVVDKRHLKAKRSRGKPKRR